MESSHKTYHITTTYNEKNLYEAYKSLGASKIGILLVILSGVAIILSIITIFLGGSWDVSNTFLLLLPFITGMCSIPYSRARFHVINMLSRYHCNKVKYDLTFNNDGIEIFNTVSKGTINIFYSQCDSFHNTKNLFVLCFNRISIIVIEKNSFKKGEMINFESFIKQQIKKKSKHNFLKNLSV